MNGEALRQVNTQGAPLTTALGVLGMPGFTAYSGFKVIGRPKAGETLAVAAASGPVGSLVGQLAGLQGLRTVGIAGGPDKCAYVRDELGFDAAVDHRDADFQSRLADECPKGIDIYFENVGGPVWDAVLPLLNQFARVPVCGLIASYNGNGSSEIDRLPNTMLAVLRRSISVRGISGGTLSSVHRRDRTDGRRRSHQVSGRHHKWIGKRATGVHRYANAKEFREIACPRLSLSRLRMVLSHDGNNRELLSDRLFDIFPNREDTSEIRLHIFVLI